MCNACGFLCCASDCFEGCGCDHCGCSACWSDEDFYDGADDYPFDEDTAAMCAAYQQDDFIPTPPINSTRPPRLRLGETGRSINRD